ncbi:MAG: exonuclease SbcCD subunit D C-terminal domain-containing protein, partial [Deltaproteobacteria bacterium]|nr:exonuclease SbcCD subunit D C-terminal domain-containing protein [Deltaproteobacteria bacterium]
HTLHDLSRAREHRLFFDFLYEVIREHAVDLLLVAGDVFETANPPAEAQNDWYEFLATAHRRFPRLDIVVVGGNHDSAARLDAPNPLLRGLGSAAKGGGRVHVLGGLPRKEDGRLDMSRLVVPVRNALGVAAWVCAVPFLRPADLPRPDETGRRHEDDLIDGVWRTYEEVIAEARRRKADEHAIVAMGHCYMAGGSLSELSERKILGGNQHALPASLFPEDVAYVALGHLHKAQSVGAPHVRYCGSPIPLSLGERNYEHQVLLVELEGAAFSRARPIPVPRRIDILRVPDEGAETPEKVLEALAALPEDAFLPEVADLGPPANEIPAGWSTGQLSLIGTPADGGPATAPLAPPPGSLGGPIDRPLLEVQVLLQLPDPALRRTIEEALVGKRARLVKLGVTYMGDQGEVSAPTRQNLRDLDPEDVFLQLYERTFDATPPSELLAAYSDLLDAVHQDDLP